MGAKPWFRFYPDNWRSDAALRLCSMGARGLWMELLCLMDAAEPRGHLLVKGLRPSVKQIAALAGCDPAECLTYLQELEAHGVFTRLRSGVITSRKMVRDTRISAEQSARKRGDKPEINESSGGAQPTEPPKKSGSGATKKLEARGKKKEKPKRVSRAGARSTPPHPIPDDFPTEAAKEAARQKCLAEGAAVNVEREAAKFRDDALAKGKLWSSWEAAFRTWIRNSINWAIEDGKVVQLQQPDAALARRRWETWIADWRDAPSQWKEHERGPPPGQLGCRIPAEILAEFGYEPGRLAL